MVKRVYSQTVIKWLIALGIGGGTLIGSIFYYLSMVGAISVLGYSGDVVCAGTPDDPCLAYINFTANEDIFLYPVGYDPWGRNTTFEFDPDVKSWKLQRSWGSGWRSIPLDRGCTGTWCGLSNKDDKRKFSVVFREGRTYNIRLVAYKYNTWSDIKWGAFDGRIDPVWFGIKKEVKPETTYYPNRKKTVYVDGTTNLIIGGQRYADSNGTKIEDAKSFKNCEFCEGIGLVEKKDLNYQVNIKDYNYTSLNVCLGTHSGKLGVDIPVKVVDKYNVSKVAYSVKTKFLSVLDNQCFVVPFGFDKEFHFGENSTTIQLQDADTENLDDGMGLNSSPTLEFGAWSLFRIGMEDGESLAQISMIKFNISLNISSIESSKVCIYAYLNGLDDSGEGFNTTPYLVYSNFTIAGGDWTEGGGNPSNECTNNEFCFNTRPTTGYFGEPGEDFYFFGGGGEPLGWICLDVTDGISYAVTNSYNNASIYFLAHSEFGTPNSSEADFIAFRSKEYTTDTSLRPYLNITYFQDINPPSWNNNQTNSTIIGGGVVFSVNWTDDTNLSSYVFSWYNGSNWTQTNTSTDQESGTQNYKGTVVGGGSSISEYYTFTSDLENWTASTIAGTGCTPVRDTDGTTSSGTGPCNGASDCATDDAGFDDNTYVYTEMSSAACDTGEIGAITSTNSYDWDAQTGEQVSFYYHRLGTSVGSYQRLQEDSTGSWVNLWGITTIASADTWINEVTDLSSLTGVGNLRFTIEGNGAWSNDVAYDAINITSDGGVSSTNETNGTLISYNDTIDAGYPNLINFSVTVDITSYDSSASTQQSTTNPELFLQIYNGTDFEEAGNFSLTTTGNATITITDSDMINAWNTVGNRDVKLQVRHLDYYNTTTVDEVNWTGVWITSFNTEQEFLNDSSVAFNSGMCVTDFTECWSNTTKTITSTEGATVKWLYYANDTSNNKNTTDTFTFTTTAGVSDTCTWSSPSHTYQCGDSCNISSVDVGGETVIINGSGTFKWVRNITNATRIRIQNGCRAIS